MPVSQNVQA